MTRVIVHAGFHKTGTTSLQKYLKDNRRQLRRWIRFYGKAAVMNAGNHARLHAQQPFLLRRLAFRFAFRRFLGRIPDAKLIVVSREVFSGVMPGHRDWRGRLVTAYAPSAIPICREIAAELRRRFGPEVEVEFLFTVREREKWIRSVYGHLLRSIHLKQDFAAFRAQFPDLIDLEEEANRIAAALAPCKVHVARLEDYAQSHAGPAEIILELAGVPAGVRRALPQAERANTGQTPEVEAEFFRLNHSGQRKDMLKEIKDRMLKEARRK